VGAKGFYAGKFQVDEPHGQRWAAALQLLAEGQELVVYRGTGLSLAVQALLVVEVPAWVDIDGMPQDVATRDLSNAEAMVLDLAKSDADFGALASGRAVEVRLVDESYGWIYATLRDGATTFTETWSRRHPNRP
jgi:hypothetical protein